MSKEKSFIESRLYGVEDKGTVQFYQLSKELINHREYRELSFGAKILYSILFDRLQLSIRNNRLDDQGRYFIQFKVKPAQGDLRSFDEKPQAERSLTEVMNANAKTVGKYKSELKEAGLLLEVKEGLGRVNRLYLAKPCSEEETPPVDEDDSVVEEKTPSQSTQKLHLREGITPPQSTRKLLPGEDIIPPQRGTKLPPNDTDLSKTYSSDTDFSEINQSKEEHPENKAKSEKSDRIDRKAITAIKPWLNNPAVLQTNTKDNNGYKTPEEVHNTLINQYGKELLQEGIAIIQNRRVSKYGYEKYLAKVLEDLAGRRKSQEQFSSPLKNSASPGNKTPYHLKESRYRGMSEEALNAKFQQKNAALMKRIKDNSTKKEQPLRDCSFSQLLSYS